MADLYIFTGLIGSYERLVPLTHITCVCVSQLQVSVKAGGDVEG